MQFISTKQAAKKLGVSPYTVLSWANPNSKQFKATFPKGIKLTGDDGRKLAWVESEIDDYMQALIESQRCQN